MQKIEIGEPTSASDATSETPETSIEIEEELLPPAQGSGDDHPRNGNAEEDPAKGSKAGWKIHWNPMLTREA